VTDAAAVDLSTLDAPLKPVRLTTGGRAIPVNEMTAAGWRLWHRARAGEDEALFALVRQICPDMTDEEFAGLSARKMVAIANVAAGRIELVLQMLGNADAPSGAAPTPSPNPAASSSPGTTSPSSA
jgi:hypothetical protein